MPLDLNNSNIQHLIESGFSITQIEQSPTLVQLLNKFNGTIDIDSDNSKNLVGAKSSGAHIQIAKGYDNLPIIAHEIAHATGKYQQINRNKNNLYQYNDPKEYGMARAKAEGEATYYEYLVARELGITHFKKPLWRDNEANPKNQDMYEYVGYVVDSSANEDDIINTLATLNQDMLSSGQLHTPLYTYDEYNTLVFLNNRHPESKISEDYRQAMGKDFDWNTYEAKSLANKANNYYGTMGNDVLVNQHDGGSALGQQGQGDLMWGSAGNDLLIGNSGKNILLGGNDNDVLIGGAGDDTLAGGKGNDLYYLQSGFGHDMIVNTGGGKDNVYFADISFDQLTLISRENQDLTLNIASNEVANLAENPSPSHDQLTVKDFYKGGESADLNFYFGSGEVITHQQILAGSSMPNDDNQPIDYEHQHALEQSLNMLQDKNIFSKLSKK